MNREELMEKIARAIYDNSQPYTDDAKKKIEFGDYNTILWDELYEQAEAVLKAIGEYLPSGRERPTVVEKFNPPLQDGTFEQVSRFPDNRQALYTQFKNACEGK